MKRRDFLKHAVTGTAGVAAGVTAVAGCGGGEPATADGPAVVTTKKVRWRMASSFPRGLDTIYGAAEVLAETRSASTSASVSRR